MLEWNKETRGDMQRVDANPQAEGHWAGADTDCCPNLELQTFLNANGQISALILDF